MASETELFSDNSEARDKLSLAKHLIAIYSQSRAGLKELGILRSERALQGDYAEWLTAEILGLRLSDDLVKKGFDARDSAGNTYQIKSRIVSDMSASTSFDISNIRFRFDFLIGVFFDSTFNLLAIIQVPYDDVQEMGSQTKSSFRFRWGDKVACDERIEYLFKRIE